MINAKELISDYKTSFTPMEEDAPIRPFYTRNYAQTGSMGSAQVCISVSSKYPSENGIAFTTIEKFVDEKRKEVIDNVLTLKPEYITFDLTGDCSVFFQSLIGDKNIYYELFFTEDIKGGVEAVTNIYKNGKVLFAYGGSIEDTFSKIHSK